MTKKTRNFVLVSGAILIIGLGTGLVASYMGLPVSLLSSAAGPDELQYVPQNAAVVAYANVRDVMNSEFRQRFRKLEPPALEHGGTAQDYQGKRLLIHDGNPPGEDMAVGFIESDLVAVGSLEAV